MGIGLYARVSTRDKDQNPENQLRPMREYAWARGWETAEYMDKRPAGDMRGRKDWARLLADTRRRRIDMVMAWKLDRCFRSSLHAHSVLEELKGLGVGFRFHTQDIDTTTAAGRMVYAMLAAVAEFEKELISERTAAGLEKARAEGKRIGRPKGKPIEQHRRWIEVRDLVLAGTLTRAEGARRLRVRYGTLVKALPPSENGGRRPQLAESA